MNKNVLIVHYNTPVLTAHLVKSINKHTPGTHIYIFDNSDKLPFVSTFENVTVFDNTKGQIINFNEWLKKYPKRIHSGGKANNWGSAKHAYSVERAMQMIKEPLVLLDSDVLIRKDFSSFFDPSVCYKGEVIYQPKSKIKRVLPFICYINTPMCFSKGIHYFDERYMHGLRVGLIGDSYDTGAALYLLTEKFKGAHREIKVSDYVVHYGNGSWVGAAEKMKREKHVPVSEWLSTYKNLWKEDNTEKRPSKSFMEVFDHIYCLHYLPDSDRLPILKSELARVGIDEASSKFSWVYDFPSPLTDLVFQDKRLNMSPILRSSSRSYIKRVSLRHYEIIKEAFELGYNRVLILENDIRFHNDCDYISKMLEHMPDSDVVMFDKMTCSAPAENLKYKQYIKTLPPGTLYGDMRSGNVFYIFCSCYALNRTAMKRIIDLHEQGLLPPDTPLNDKSLTGSFAIVNVAIQDPKLKTRKIESYDRIGLDTGKYRNENSYPVIEPVTKPNGDKMVSASVKKEPTKIRAMITGGKKVLPTKPASQMIKRPVVPDKRKTSKIRTISAKTTGHNKLYDV